MSDMSECVFEREGVCVCVYICTSLTGTQTLIMRDSNETNNETTEAKSTHGESYKTHST